MIIYYTKSVYINTFNELMHSDGQSMDYGEVMNAFSRLVETHFIQRCPPVDCLGATASRKSSSGTSATSSSGAPATSTPQSDQPESHPDCYKLPQINLSGKCPDVSLARVCFRKYQLAVSGNKMLTAVCMKIVCVRYTEYISMTLSLKEVRIHSDSQDLQPIRKRERAPERVNKDQWIIAGIRKKE